MLALLLVRVWNRRPELQTESSITTTHALPLRAKVAGRTTGPQALLLLVVAVAQTVETGGVTLLVAVVAGLRPYCFGRWGWWVAARAALGRGGGYLVLVELEEVVGGGNQPPF
jgi:hypothetical protein